MNKFLKSLEITFRRDVGLPVPLCGKKSKSNQETLQPTNFRPRINKLNSLLDKEQKVMILATLSLFVADALSRLQASGHYFFLDDQL